MKGMKSYLSEGAMNRDTDDAESKQDLRRRAEARMKDGQGAGTDDLAGENPIALIHELQVHQIELEMQNEELRHSQAVAQELYQRFQDLYDFAPICYLTLDPNGMILEANLAAASYLGVERGALRTSNFKTYLRRHSIQPFKAFMDLVLATGTRQTCELKLIHKRDRSVSAITEGIAAVSPDSGELGVRIALTDITERRRMEEEIKVLNRALGLKADGLEAANRDLQSFVSSVSHDLRNPVSLIGSACFLVEGQADRLDQEGREMLAAIGRTCREMGETITALLDLARASWGTFRCVTTDLSRLANETAEELRRRHPERDAVFAISSGLVAYCDPVLLKIVLENLMGNAWKFTATRPRVRIEFGVEDSRGERVFFVRDNGIGFDMAGADKLFTPFERLDCQVKVEGHGVGLESSRRIIERHGGRIWAESEPDQGATFFFTLPDGQCGENS